MTERIQSFSPIVDENSEILILGSVPGIRSLEMNEYYAHPQNTFWRILFQIFNEDFTNHYQEKILFLKKHHIALWDVIESCERKGSTDATIKNEDENDIVSLLDSYPNIKAIFCNGQKSYKNLIKILGKNFRLPIYVLPSTSPLHTISLDEKYKIWSVFIKSPKIS